MPNPLNAHGPSPGQKRLFQAAIVSLAALVVLAKLPPADEMLRVIHKTGHPLVFGLMALLLSHMSFHRVALGLDSARSHYLKVIASIAALGALTEIAQIPLNRGASVLDVFRDLGGASAVLCMVWVWRNWHDPHPVSRSRRTGVLVLGIALILISTSPLTWCIAAYVNRYQQWPVVLQFGSPLDTYFLAHDPTGVETVRLPVEWAHHSGEMAAYAVATRNYTAGVRMTEPRADWHEFDALAVDVTNPGDKPLGLIVRVHDKTHNWETEDRYNGHSVVPPHTRMIERIPLSVIEAAPQGRKMDLRQIAGIAVFTENHSPQKVFLLSRFSLEKGPPPTAERTSANDVSAPVSGR
ncbi:MAG: hypothetical protein ABI885_10895 [Gammaproteobacteria bacterium]